METMNPERAAPVQRLIKRYSNRKLYDTSNSRYVTLLEIAAMVRAGEDVQVIDNSTKEDKTEMTLALIISEELKERPRGIPLPTLKALIRHRGERLMTTLRDGPIGRLMPRDAEMGGPGQASDGPSDVSDSASPIEPPELAEEQAPPSQPASLGTLRRRLEQWQAAVDERIRAVLPESGDVEALKLEVKALNERLTKLEEQVSGKQE